MYTDVRVRINEYFNGSRSLIVFYQHICRIKLVLRHIPMNIWYETKRCIVIEVKATCFKRTATNVFIPFAREARLSSVTFGDVIASLANRLLQ